MTARGRLIIAPTTPAVRLLEKLEFGGDDMVERAYMNDIAALTALRLEFLQEDCGELNEEVISKLAEALPA